MFYIVMIMICWLQQKNKNNTADSFTFLKKMRLNIYYKSSRVLNLIVFLKVSDLNALLYTYSITLFAMANKSFRTDTTNLYK